MGIAGLAGGVASAAVGASNAAKENARARREIGAARADNKRWYDIRMSQDYTQRSDAQSVLNNERETYDDAIRRIRATNAVAGGTDATVAAAQQAAASGVARTASTIASAGASYKEGVENRYRAAEAGYVQQEAAAHANQANAISQAAGQAASAFGNLVGVGADMEKGKPSEGDFLDRLFNKRDDG